MPESDADTPDTHHAPLAPARPPARLHLVCGKIAAGKSTLCRALATQPLTIRLAEDDWLPRLFPGEIHTLEDYRRCSARLRDAVAPHVVALLGSGMSVVLDFPANTLATRAWAMTLIRDAGVDHRLHFLDVSDAVCKARLRARNASGEHPYQTDDAQFDQFTRHFVAPGDAEGFRVIRHPDGDTTGFAIAQ